jgi:hypothetical protein
MASSRNVMIAIAVIVAVIAIYYGLTAWKWW